MSFIICYNATEIIISAFRPLVWSFQNSQQFKTNFKFFCNSCFGSFINVSNFCLVNLVTTISDTVRLRWRPGSIWTGHPTWNTWRVIQRRVITLTWIHYMEKSSNTWRVVGCNLDLEKTWVIFTPRRRKCRKTIWWKLFVETSPQSEYLFFYTSDTFYQYSLSIFEGRDALVDNLRGPYKWLSYG